MKTRLFQLASAVTLGSLSILAAQAPPASPRNLRISRQVPDPASSPKAVPCAIPDARGGPHRYFDSLVRLSEHFCNWSLRDQAQLDSLVAQGPSTHFTYSPETDNYPAKQDAAKFFKINSGNGSGSVPTTQQLRFQGFGEDLGTSAKSIIFTWDWYWGPEFRDNRGGVSNYKTFQFQMDGHTWWTLMNSSAPAETLSAGTVAVVTDEFSAGHGVEPGPLAPNGMLNSERVIPSGPGTPYSQASYATALPLYQARWNRYWVEIRPAQPHTAFTDWNAAYGVTLQPNPNDPQGRWHMVSVWIADEQRAPIRSLYRVPVGWNSARGWRPHISLFRFEMNSSKTGFVGPFIGYGRNVAILRDYALPHVNPESDTFLFQKPVR